MIRWRLAERLATKVALAALIALFCHAKPASSDEQNAWASLKPGMSIEVKDYSHLPRNIRKILPEDCPSDPEGAQMAKVSVLFVKLSNELDPLSKEMALAVASCRHLIGKSIVFENDRGVIRRLVFASYGAQGWGVTQFLGHVQIDPKTGKITSMDGGDACGDEGWIRETYEIKNGAYALSMVESVDCEGDSSKTKVIWQAVRD